MGRNKSFHRVLLTRFSALGDVAMTLPVVYDACRASGYVSFVLLTTPLPAKLFVNKPANLEVITFNKSEHRGIAGMWRLARQLKGEYDFDAMIDLHDVLRTKIMRLAFAAMGMSTYRIDKGRKEKRQLVRQRGKIAVQLKPMERRYRDCFEKASLPAPPHFTTLFSGADMVANVAAQKSEGEKWVAIAPYTAHKGKCYPENMMDRVIAHFALKEGCRVFLFGGREDVERIDARCGKYAGVVNVAAIGTGLPYELALMSRCDVMLSMDSANMHLAALAGCRVVSIWGATHRFAGFMARGQRPEDIVEADIPCRPCSVYGNKRCVRGDYICLKAIPSAEVIEAVESALKQ